jgi:hypothetical protein
MVSISYCPTERQYIVSTLNLNISGKNHDFDLGSFASG